MVRIVVVILNKKMFFFSFVKVIVTDMLQINFLIIQLLLK